jgi:hypothetical protein
MDDPRHTPSPARPWHALLAPLPDDVVLRRQPVAPPEILATPEGAAIAGWEQLTVELSAGAAGLRHVMVVLDATGRPISANDTVLYRRPLPSPDAATGAGDVESCQQSLGGRIEQDGSFRGTRWDSSYVEKADGSEPRIEPVSSVPTAAHVAGIEALVADILRRAAGQGEAR